ncbi:hypothetical protein ACH4SP_25890 [Streptomyces sp. NPDC021093]|uniref:hypothetical protein n=1 Tax=Streptomyces sp. NPDC021093 TaxID=3365112 RepID=UPI00379D37B9
MNGTVPYSVEVFCRYYSLLSQVLDTPEQQNALDAAREAARRGDDLGAAIRGVLVTVPAPEPAAEEDDPDVAPLTELLRRIGIAYREADRYGRSDTLGDGGGQAVPEIFQCPARRCTRVWVREPGRQTPECHLDDRPLLERGATP